MGADLCVFILVGPSKIDEKLLNREMALAQVRPILESVKKWAVYIRALEAVDNTDNLPPVEPEGVDEAIKEDFDHYSALLDIDPEEAVTDFFFLWNQCYYRDASCRMFGDRQILVAGDSSWGDAPEGDGYRICKQSELLGLFSLFDIE